MTLAQGIDLGPFSFTVLRILIAVAFLRVFLRKERLTGGMNSLDWFMVVWAGWAVANSVFHKEPSAAIIFRLGQVYNICGVYFIFRCFCRSLDDVIRLFIITAIVLVPVALEMGFEKVVGRNLFSALGGVSEFPAIREGKLRAQGPFAHAILAGTVGAVCLPLMIGLRKIKRREASAGIGACIIMVFASASSGPILSALAGIGALFMWHYRAHMRIVRWLAVFGYIGLDMIMKAPAYYIIWRINPLGGTGYHRAALIESAFNHINEWWLWGTDYTRHWMPTGVTWSPDHVDITNYYLHFGVMGGLPLMLLFIGIIAKGFSFVGQMLRKTSDLPFRFRFMLWALGASLFTHAVTGISVSYFDQSFIFLYMTLAAIGSTWSGIKISAHSFSGSTSQNDIR